MLVNGYRLSSCLFLTCLIDKKRMKDFDKKNNHTASFSFLQILSHLAISMRLNNPLPILFVFLPTTSGLFFSNPYLNQLEPTVFRLIIFAIGSFLARSAFCILNDIIDKDVDSLIRRTSQRPIASGKLSPMIAFVFALFLCLIGLLVSTFLNILAFKILLGGVLVGIIYPFAKRFFYYSQMLNGAIMNCGFLVGVASVTEYVPLSAILFYIGLVYSTSIADTIYSYQDAMYDIKIGLKSMAVLYGENGKTRLATFAHTMFFCFVCVPVVGRWADHIYISPLFYVFVVIVYFFQLDIIKKVDLKNHVSCMSAFKSQAVLLFILMVGCLSTNINL